MSGPKLNECYCRALAAWAAPGEGHDFKACSSEYALQQLQKAAVRSPSGLRTELLNDHTVKGRVERLGKLRGFKSILELPPTPTMHDLKRLIAICYNLPQLNFTEDEKYENESFSDEEIASNIVGRLCEFLGYFVPENLSSDVSMLCNMLRLLYTVIDERTTPSRAYWHPPITVNRLPAPPHKHLTKDTDTSPSLLSYEKPQ